MQVQLIKVICDTNFLIHLATTRIKNISNLDTEIGPISFVVPTVVISELKKLSQISDKQKKVAATLAYIQNLPTLEISGTFADKEILTYIKNRGGIIATLDKKLKLQIKSLGGSVMSLSNDRIILES